MFQPAAERPARAGLRIDLPNRLARDLVHPAPARVPGRASAAGGRAQHHRPPRRPRARGLRLRAARRARWPTPSLVARPLGVLRMRNVASPAYLRARARRGRWPTWRSTASSTTRPLGARARAGSTRRTAARPRAADARAIVVNGTDAYQAACLAGLGLIQAPVLGTQRLVDAGRLVEVLPPLTARRCRCRCSTRTGASLRRGAGRDGLAGAGGRALPRGGSGCPAAPPRASTIMAPIP